MSRGETFPPMQELVPHSGRMRLLGRVLEHTPERTVCSLDPADSELFQEPDGSVPGWVGVEYMAQCIAAHGGLVAWNQGEKPQRGLLLGTRWTELHVDAFAPGRPLQVVSNHLRGDRALVWFDCTIEPAGGGEPLARGRLSVYAMEGEAQHGP